MKTRLLACLFAAAGALALTGAAHAAANVRIDDNGVFPESLGSANGALYIGSSAKGIVYRAKPGSAYAEPFLAAQPGLPLVLGVLADAPSNTLWVCYNNGTDKAVLKTFDLKSGKAKSSYDFPGGGLCNDIALKNGDAYATDTIKGRILKITKGGDVSVWYSNPADPSLDGIAWAKDGKLYTDTYMTSHFIRIDVNADGSAGKATVLNPSMPLFQTDGIRLSNDGRILMVEGQGHPGDANVKEGRLDEVTVQGDNATIRVIKDGFEIPTAVTQVGSTLYVLESKFDYQQRPELKGKDTGAFMAYAVPAK